MRAISKHLPCSMVVGLLMLCGSAAFAQETAEAADWVDEFLSSELQYDAEKIRQFKENVAEMPEADLRALLIRMRDARGVREELQHVRLEGQRRSLQNIADARSLALSRPMQQASYPPFGGHRPKHYFPQSSGLFLGYFVRINQ